ncbi:phage portal protein [Bacillus thuringiensis]|uniref:phage portal protein n=2 Tax=Bacillus thuringiensis TaxID=1428 RepID=UPI002D802645|nr:phage portal protein [Bacillus thuringiensis]MEB4894257.1 phage portal protein [Bacillus thuringiensis]MEC2563238.1 phage portal protein [Bacillus thuringiensis]MEC2725944.1 phage portal protein [Bacillus thuringiensis]MEC2749241.1 phage portal protein [Bacillus thuringiensis]MEC2767727.1 phage portal protein [Bacillus thuringiensis]
MGLFDKIFGKKQAPTTTRFEMINDNGGGFFSWHGDIYQSDIIRACIRPKAKAVGKLIAKHIRDNGNEFKINPEPYIRFILEEPNPLMTGQMFQEKMAIQLELNHNAFAYIKRDDYGYATEIYPIPCTTVEVVEGAYGDIFLKFYFKNGKQMTIPYTDVIHLRKDFNDNDFFGEHPGNALSQLMEIVTTTDQGIVKAIKNSAVVKWILKFKSVLKQEDIDNQVKNFVNNYLNIANDGGAASSDPRYDLEQVKPEAFVPDSKQMQETVQRIYNFFNTNEKIIQSKYDENEWVSYFESEIEPLALQLSGEFTRKLFTKRERGSGNKIIFESSNLQHASMSTKLNLTQFVDRGMMTPNEVRRILNMGPIEGGDRVLMRLDMAPIDSENDAITKENDTKDTEKQPNSKE